jgi:hypothetical protein
MSPLRQHVADPQAANALGPASATLVAGKVQWKNIYNPDGLAKYLLGCDGQFIGIVSLDFCCTVLVWNEDVQDALVGGLYPHAGAKPFKFSSAYQGAQYRLNGKLLVRGWMHFTLRKDITAMRLGAM